MAKSLIVSCCQSKLEGTHKAIDIYQGKAFKLIRKENLLDTVDVWILSRTDSFVRTNIVV